jgi:phosphoglycolate phosphatase
MNAPLRAAVFDFDGTLARPALDFALMTRRIGGVAARHLGREATPGTLPALEWIEKIAGGLGGGQGHEFSAEAHAIIEEMEREAAANTSLFGFTRPALSRLRERGAAPAIITRNTRASVLAVFPDVFDFLSVVVTREDVRAVKPDPAHLLAALGALGVKPAQALMAGDHPTDVLTARRTGAYAAAVASGGTSRAGLLLAEPDILAEDVGELMAILEERGMI